MSFPRYERYKDSGVEWLGDVPEEWEVIGLKRLCKVITDGAHISPATDNGRFPFVSTRDVRDELIDFDNCLLTSEESFRYLVKAGCKPLAGDVLFSKDGTIGRTVVVKEDSDFVVASSLIIIRPDDSLLSPVFLNYLCSSNVVVHQVESFVKGAGLPRLSIQNLMKVFGVFPSIAEQYAISAYLNHETSKIDVLIAEQQRLITLLKEKRQAVITRAVTKGLNPDALMKDSGIEWLGEVPERWCVMRICILFSEVNDQGSDQLPILTVSIHHGVSDSELDEKEQDRKVTRSEDRTKYKAVKPGDLVYNMMRAWQGGFGAVTVDGQVSPAYVVARPKANISTKFVEQVLRTSLAVEEMKRHSRGITDFRLRLYWEEFKTIKVAVPPIDEQMSIMGFVDSECEKIEALVAEAQRSIQLMQERRSVLISAAVTGKIDVRAFAASNSD